MKFSNVLVSLVAIVALAISLIANVSASSIGVDISGVESDNIAVFAGQSIPVRVVFSSDTSATNAIVRAWISGEKDSLSTERFDIVAGKVYSRLFSVKVPSRVDPSEDLKFKVVVESRNGGVIVEKTITLAVQRESYNIKVLDVLMNSEIKAGEALAFDIVLKNNGRQSSEDIFVIAKIPALGVEKKAYFGDLSPVDQSNPDGEDAVEKRIVLNIPSSAATGIYIVEIEVYNEDFATVSTQKVSITGNSAEGTSATSEETGSSKTSNTAVVLTVILAIIFVVLLIVLIVLLTRKPENKSEEFGESYY